MPIYLDYNATTPLSKEVCSLLDECNRNTYGNPSSPYRIARESREKLEEAREKAAKLIGCSRQEVVFTSGGTESNNLAIEGIIGDRQGGHTVTSLIEHLSVLAVFRRAEREERIKVTYLPADSKGFVSARSLKDSLREDTVFVSVMLANNEVGSIQEIGEMVKVVKAADKNIIFHTDAVQGLGKLEIDVKDLGVDLMSISSHKIYGPKGVGALYIKKGTNLKPLFSGGHQEKNVRPGTENLCSVIGFGHACGMAAKELGENIRKFGKLKSFFASKLSEKIKDAANMKINSPPENCLPNTLNISFEKIDAELLISYLSQEEIYVSSGSACTTGSLEPSHVLLAMGLAPGLAKNAVRFSLGAENTEEELAEAAEKLKKIITERFGS